MMNELQREIIRAKNINSVIHMMDNRRASLAYREGALTVDGVEFVLMPERKHHTEADVRYAKACLRNDRDVTRFRVEWAP